MKRNIVIFLIFTLFLVLNDPILLETTLAQANTETTTIDVINSKTVRTINDGFPEGHEPGEWSPSYGAYFNYVGYDEDAGKIYEEESILQFDLDKVSDKTIVSAKLKFDVLFGSNADWGIWASDDNGWESDATIPDKTRLINNGTRVESGVNSIDVTSFFRSEFNGAVEKATFIISHTDPSKKGSQSYFAFFSMGENLPGNRQQPTLEVTYLTNQPPTGQIEMIANDNFVNHRNVFLKITGEDLDGDPMELNISNSSQFVEEEWKPFQSPHSQEWELPAGDGLKTVYMQLRDAHGNRSSVYDASVILDTTKPTGNITINNGADYTTDPNVTLVIEGTDEHEVALMRFSNQADDWSSSHWVPYATTHDWTLDVSTDGEKRVFMQLQDKAGNISDPIASNIIFLNRKALQGTLQINSGATHTNNTKVQLTLTVDNGGYGTDSVLMSFSNNNITWTGWEPFDVSKEWYLVASEGQKTVYMKLKDAVGNESEEISGSIYLDITPPTGNITVNGGGKYTNTRNVRLSVSADDGNGVGDIQVQFSNDEQIWNDAQWLDYDNLAQEYDWQLTEGDGEKYVYMKLRDRLGNESTWAIISDSIILDTTPPTVTGVVDGEIYNVDVTIGFDEGTATLNGTPFANGTTVSAEGSYTLIVTDVAGNITVVDFVINKALPAPTDLVGTSGNRVVTLQWTGVLGADSSNTGEYRIYRSTTSGLYDFGSPLATVAGSGHNTYHYQSKGLTNGATYYFVVTTYLDGKESAPSNEVSAIPMTVPKAPTDVKAIAGNGIATLSFNVPTDNGGSQITGYEVSDQHGKIVAKADSSPITITGLTNGKSYTFTVKAINKVGKSMASEPSNEITPKAPSNDNDDDYGGSGPTTTAPPASPPATKPMPDETIVDIIVNGQVLKVGKAITEMIGHQQVTTITINDDSLEQKLSEEDEGFVISIPWFNNSDVVIATLSGQMVKDMEEKEAVVELITAHATYILPAKQFKIDALAKQFASVELQDIEIQIAISTLTAEQLQAVEEVASNGDFAIVAPPLNFTVKGIYKGNRLNISAFDAYIKRTITIPDNVDPRKITTAIVIESNGTVRHVPTKVELMNGQYIAVINSLSNSTYTLIWNPIEFQDIADHWAKDTINNMAARKIVNGIDDQSYRPDQHITRAEFASIIVRALGLKLENRTIPFIDVKPSDWYSGVVQTAYAHKLINGFDDGTFHPNDKMTREQAMVILSKAMEITKQNEQMQKQLPEQLLGAFNDATDVSTWAKNGVVASLQAGLVTGRNNEELAPKEYITRAEVAVIIQRLLQKSGLI